MSGGLFGAAAAQDTHVLFFALLPDGATHTALTAAVNALRAAHTGAGRWSSPERHHITLHYLGSFQPLRPDVLAAAKAAADNVHVPAFDLVLDRAGHFSQGIGWLGPGVVPDGLMHLHAALRQALTRARVRIEGETSFVPHLTVVRGNTAPLAEPVIPPVHWRVREFALVDSVQGTHRIAGRWLLSGA